MKKLVLSLLSLLIILVLLPNAGHADAGNSVSLVLNGKRLSTEVPPKVVGAGTTLVPLRTITEALGSKVSWTGNDQPITVEKDGLRIELQIGNTAATVDGKPVTLEAAPILQDNVTMLPIRFLAERFGLTVGWDQKEQTVQLTQKPIADTSLPAPTTGSVVTPSVPGGTAAPTSPADSKTPSSPALPTLPADSKTPASPTPPPPPAKVEAAGASPAPAVSSPPPYNLKFPEVWSIGLTSTGLSIKTTGPVQPAIFTLPNPDRVVIDLPGAALTKAMVNGPGQSGELDVNDPNVSKIRYSLFSSDPLKVRIVVDLKAKIDYNLIDSKNPLELLLAFGSGSAAGGSTAGKKFKVVVDAGHGGHDSGAISASGFMEKDFTLSLATKVYQLLLKEPQIQPIATRSDDTFIELDRRVDIANSQNADLFVSIHGNKYDNPTVDGTETYYNRPDSEALADTLHKLILAATGFDDRGVRTADYRVIKKTTMPAVLCEIGFLSNPDNEASMYRPDFQDKVAASIVQGIKSYLQIK